MTPDGPVAKAVEGEKPSALILAKLAFATGGKPPEVAAGETLLKARDLLFLLIHPEAARALPDKTLEIFADSNDPRPSHLAARILAREILGQKKKADNLREKLSRRWDRFLMMPEADRVDVVERGTFHRYRPGDLLLFLAASKDFTQFPLRRTLNLFTHFTEREWGLDLPGGGRFLLPSAEYWLIREALRLQPEPGDILTVKVRVENRCLETLERGLDLVKLLIKAAFQPALVFIDSWSSQGIEVTGDFQWTAESLAAGGVLEFFYQAYIPESAGAGFIDGLLTARGFTDENGNICEDTADTGRLPVTPLRPLDGLVYEDWNVNGRRDPGENGISGVRMRDTRGRYYLTDGEGRFRIAAGNDLTGIQLDPSSLPTDLVMTTPLTRMVSRLYNAPVAFGLVPCVTVSGRVMIDPESANSPIAGAGVIAGDRRVHTDSKGRFRMVNLPRILVDKIRLESPAGQVLRVDPVPDRKR